MIETDDMMKILSMLVSKTEQRTILWHETEEDAFLISFPLSSLILRKMITKSGYIIYSLVALNTSGEKVGALNSGDSEDVSLTLMKLHENVARLIHRVDETFKDILQGLSDSKIH
jgi:hypothetical protein